MYLSWCRVWESIRTDAKLRWEYRGLSVYHNSTETNMNFALFGFCCFGWFCSFLFVFLLCCCFLFICFVFVFVVVFCVFYFCVCCFLCVCCGFVFWCFFVFVFCFVFLFLLFFCVFCFLSFVFFVGSQRQTSTYKAYKHIHEWNQRYVRLPRGAGLLQRVKHLQHIICFAPIELSTAETTLTSCVKSATDYSTSLLDFNSLNKDYPRVPMSKHVMAFLGRKLQSQHY